MVAFRPDPSEFQRLDWSLLQNGPVVLYYRAAVLEGDLARLASEGYALDVFDASAWNSELDFHQDAASRLNLPSYYGHNLNAFNDCLGDLEIPEIGGRGLVFRRFDTFARRDPRVAQFLLDIAASTAWTHLLFGRRLLTLVQSDDPQIQFAPVGAHGVSWNPQEWPNSRRGA